MSKLCKSCGQYYDGDFCDKCGYGNPRIKTKSADKYKKPTTPERFRTEEQKKQYAQWEEEKAENKAEYHKKNKSRTSSVQLLVVVAVVVVGVIVAVLFKSGVIFSSNEKDLVKDYFSAIEQNDFDKFIKCFPDEMKKEYVNEQKQLGLTGQEYMQKLYGTFSDDYGNGYKIEVNFGKTTKLAKGEYDMSGYEKAYGTVPDISDACEMVVNVTFKGSKNTETAKLYMYVGKVSGRWKIFNMTQDNGIIDNSMQIKS